MNSVCIIRFYNIMIIVALLGTLHFVVQHVQESLTS